MVWLILLYIISTLKNESKLTCIKYLEKFLTTQHQNIVWAFKAIAEFARFTRREFRNKKRGPFPIIVPSSEYVHSLGLVNGLKKPYTLRRPNIKRLSEGVFVFFLNLHLFLVKNEKRSHWATLFPPALFLAFQHSRGTQRFTPKNTSATKTPPQRIVINKFRLKLE